MPEEVLRDLNGLLITNPINIRYLTGFIGMTPEEREAYALIAKDQTYLFTNALYREEAKKTKAMFMEISRENPISKELSRIVSELKIKKLGFEDDNLTVAEYTKLKSVVNAELIPSRNQIEKLRMTKREDEIANIRLATNLTDLCFKFITRRIRPGVTEARLALEIEGFFKYRGAENAFSPIVAFGKNSSMPHYNSLSQRSKKNQSLALKSNDIVLLDFGARVNGYCADMTRVVFVGKPKAEWVAAYNAVLAAQQKALDLLSAGERHGATLDAAAREMIAEADLPPYPHSLGHNVGLAIHEGPRLTVKKDEVLSPGMVFSIEPGVYIEGRYGIRIEDLVRLTPNGMEILSRSPKELTIV